MGVGATGILKCARSPAGAGGGRVAVTLHRKPPGGWSGRVGLGRKGVLEEETASAQPAGVARSGALGSPGHGPGATLGAQPLGMAVRLRGWRGARSPVRGSALGPAGWGPGLGAAAVLRERAWPRSRTELRGARTAPGVCPGASSC